MRLAESPLGKHAGRVEVKYYGRWGTICDSGWQYSSGRVICKYVFFKSTCYSITNPETSSYFYSMLNFPGVVCAVTSGTHVFGEGSGHVWLTDLRCYHYSALTLNDCTNNLPRSTNPCSHSRDAAVICQGNCMSPFSMHAKGLTLYILSQRLIVCNSFAHYFPQIIASCQWPTTSLRLSKLLVLYHYHGRYVYC